jgi:hypothetical protein
VVPDRGHIRSAPAHEPGPTTSPGESVVPSSPGLIRDLGRGGEGPSIYLTGPRTDRDAPGSPAGSHLWGRHLPSVDSTIPRRRPVRQFRPGFRGPRAPGAGGTAGRPGVVGLLGHSRRGQRPPGPHLLWPVGAPAGGRRHLRVRTGGLRRAGSRDHRLAGRPLELHRGPRRGPDRSVLPGVRLPVDPPRDLRPGLRGGRQRLRGQLPGGHPFEPGPARRRRAHRRSPGHGGAGGR